MMCSSTVSIDTEDKQECENSSALAIFFIHKISSHYLFLMSCLPKQSCFRMNSLENCLGAKKILMSILLSSALLLDTRLNQLDSVARFVNVSSTTVTS